MILYHKHVLPHLVNWACKQETSLRQRRKIVPLATGNVLEIGVGSGLNLPVYDPSKVKRLTAIDPSRDMWQKNIVDTDSLPFAFSFVEAFAEQIPEENDQFDTVVITYTLCTISDTQRALEEIRRVLRPGGKLLFCEHGKAPDSATRQQQKMVNPLWKRLGGGCHLNKDIPSLIEAGGFRMMKSNQGYIPGWKPASYNYWGIAKPD